VSPETWEWQPAHATTHTCSASGHDCYSARCTQPVSPTSSSALDHARLRSRGSASRLGVLHCHAIIDERCAAFAALGFARATGRPAAILCTSGTAPAHYFPALVEAALAFLPLLVITADRPFELQHSGAAQSIDQVKLYGDHVRRYFELGLPDAAQSALIGLRRAVTHAVAISQGPYPGRYTSTRARANPWSHCPPRAMNRRRSARASAPCWPRR
jgi:hypothetical protein